jgi:ATP/maltotriose-dependent transcriptional regulator MalT
MDDGRAKQTQSRAQRLIKRPRLTTLLDESEARVILLVAPAGYGKTTLARQWLEGRGDIVWYAAGPAIADVAALATGLTIAFTRKQDASRQREAIDRVQALAAGGASTEGLAHAVAEAASQESAFLFIDDYHYGAESDESNAFLTSLLAQISMRVVVASRVRPTWVTSRMGVYGEATIVETSQLAFTQQEAEAVLAVDGTTDDWILNQARGWPAVIGLAAMCSESAHPDGRLPPEQLYDFFADDLYKRASEELRAALLLLALGGDADRRVARETLGDQADAILLEASELGFLTRARDQTVSMHPLLRGFLISRLHELEHDEIALRVSQVTQVLARHSRWDECLVVLQEFPQPQSIVTTLNGALADLLDSGRVATVERWVELAAASAIADPILMLAEAEILLRRGKTAKAQALAERAGQLLRGDAAARAYLVASRASHLGDDPTSAAANAERVHELATSISLQVEALYIQLVSATERPDDGSGAILERLRALEDDRPDHALRLVTAEGLLSMTTGGDARAAAREFERGAGLLPYVHDPFSRTNYFNVFAHVLVGLSQYDAALVLIDQLVDEARASGLDFPIDHALLTKAAALSGARRFADAQRALTELEQRPAIASPHVSANANLQRARLRIGLGDLKTAGILLAERSPELTSTALQRELLAHRGLLLAASGQTRDARAALSEAALRPGYIGATALADVGWAIVAIQERKGDAEVIAANAIRANFRIGHFDSVVVACRAFPDLAIAASHETDAADILTMILTQAHDRDLGRRAGLMMPREIRRGTVLSPRERDVYELLIQGRTNRDIAKTLFISESTAKVHVRHIFEKLGVHSRAEAARSRLVDE